MPPACGIMAASSPYVSAPLTVSSPVSAHAANNQLALPIWRDISAGTIKMPDPIMTPTRRSSPPYASQIGSGILAFILPGRKRDCVRQYSIGGQAFALPSMVLRTWRQMAVASFFLRLLRAPRHSTTTSSVSISQPILCLNSPPIVDTQPTWSFLLTVTQLFSSLDFALGQPPKFEQGISAQPEHRSDYPIAYHRNTLILSLVPY